MSTTSGDDFPPKRTESADSRAGWRAHSGSVKIGKGSRSCCGGLALIVNTRSHATAARYAAEPDFASGRAAGFSASSGTRERGGVRAGALARATGSISATCYRPCAVRQRFYEPMWRRGTAGCYALRANASSGLTPVRGYCCPMEYDRQQCSIPDVQRARAAQSRVSQVPLPPEDREPSGICSAGRRIRFIQQIELRDATLASLMDEVSSVSSSRVRGSTPSRRNHHAAQADEAETRTATSKSSTFRGEGSLPQPKTRHTPTTWPSGPKDEAPAARISKATAST